MEYIELEHIATGYPERVEIDPEVIDTDQKAFDHLDKVMPNWELDFFFEKRTNQNWAKSSRNCDEKGVYKRVKMRYNGTHKIRK